MSNKSALEIDKLYVFGDSLSDTGNFYNLTNATFPGFPLYAPGVFSNGDIWLDSVTDELSTQVDPFINGVDPTTGEICFNFDDSNGGINFATGGATSGDENLAGVAFGIPIGLEQQIDGFELFAQIQGVEETFSDDLFSVWIGANDYLNFIKDDPTTPDVIETDFPQSGEEIKSAVIKVVDINIAGAIQDIIDAGGENVLVFNLPDLEDIPLAQKLDKKDRKALKKLTKRHNKELLDLIEETEESNPQVNLIHIDVNELVDDIVKDPEEYGLTNVVNGYTQTDLYTNSFNPTPTNPGDDPSTYLYWDSVHPTTVGHGLIADFVVEELGAEGLTM